MGQMLTIDLIFLAENMYIHQYHSKKCFTTALITSGNGKFNQKITIWFFEYVCM